jgi:hypothetical protein
MIEKYFYCIVVGDRLHDDVYCSECDRYGPVVIVDTRDGGQYDLCFDCINEVGNRQRQALFEKLSRHSDARHIRPDIIADVVEDSPGARHSDARHIRRADILPDPDDESPGTGI